MKIYTINEKGELFKVNRCYFSDYDVYLIDDDKYIYLWFGEKIGLDYQDTVVKKARELNREKGGIAKIELIRQNREYGSFLAMKENLKKGHIPDEPIERRPELILEEPKEILEAIQQKAPEVELGVAQWLNQLQTYRKLAPVEEVDKIEEEKIELKEEVMNPIEKEELVEETSVTGWLDQLIKYRKTVPQLKEELLSEDIPKEEYEWEEVVEIEERPAVTYEERPKIEYEIEPEMEIKEKTEIEMNIESNVIKWLNQLNEYRREIRGEEKIEDITELTERIDYMRIMAEDLGRRKSLHDEVLEIIGKTVKEIEEDATVREREKPLEVEGEEIVEVDFETLVRVGAYFLSQEGNSYDKLCWFLAERQLKIQMETQNIQEDLINKKAEEIFKTSCTYEELCWLIAELDTLVAQKYFDKF